MPIRADERLVASGLAPNIERARALVMEGRVLLGARKIMKPSEPVKTDAPLSIKGETDPFVSRGALKLKHAVEEFGLDLKGLCCVDIGCSTGGFTEVMLRNGASKVFSVDVGYNVLDWRLRSNEKVVCMERTNARFLTPDMFPAPLDFGATDVSFISLKAVLPAAFAVLREGARFVALIKPQFEAAREDVGEKGVVRDQRVHMEVVTDIVRFAITHKWAVEGLSFSPIRGPEGNIEFLLLLRNEKTENQDYNFDTIHDVIHAAYKKFVK